jgi:hypothetical protein
VQATADTVLAREEAVWNAWTADVAARGSAAAARTAAVNAASTAYALASAAADLAWEQADAPLRHDERLAEAAAARDAALAAAAALRDRTIDETAARVPIAAILPAIINDESPSSDDRWRFAWVDDRLGFDQAAHDHHSLADVLEQKGELEDLLDGLTPPSPPAPEDNLAPPEFLDDFYEPITTYLVTVVETAAPGSVVGRVHAWDPDRGVLVQRS